MMKLYGSVTSPFVRRVRFLCNEVSLSYDFIDSLSDTGQAAMREKNPIWKVPCTEIDGLILWDSLTIIEYLLEKFAGHEKLLRPVAIQDRWREKKLISAIDGCVESAINLFYLNKDGVKVDQVAYLVKQRARMDSILQWVKTELTENFFSGNKKIGLSELTLYSVLDWMRLRDMYPVRADAILKDFMDCHAQHPSLIATQLPG